MRTATILLILLVITGCGSGNSTPLPPANNTSAASTSANRSSAKVDGETRQLVRATAAWHPELGKLCVVLTTFDPPDEMLEAMADLRPEADGVLAMDGFLTLTFSFKDAAKPLDKANLTSWEATFEKFGVSAPLTVSREAKDISVLEVDKREGGSVRLKLALAVEAGTTYGCSVDHSIDLKVLN